ncbi:NAD-dependent epimerase/dehydratase family protein [Anaeromicropila populeti]|uniref:dTDP-L-rhamnose 4-epimerase n=1 Tax=Anaeromicropila populeti TaxID=37658 RepID=A0A1I6L6K1_9FIRM|nr:SDR family NAD(P)-dependent oxidoreductase [Anaeromicropila populeti]SFR99096.1 dTDP-L-rhamnose 4-epimerase [Anaeromicropila populeti]
MNKVLVIGGAGFIGHNTVKKLLAEGYEVTIMDNLQQRVHPYGDISHLDKRADFIKGDITKKEDLEKALKGIDIVFNFAAYQDHMTDFSTFYEVNSVGTALLYETIVKNNYPVKKIIFSSTQGVYGAGKFKCNHHGYFYGERTRELLEQGKWEVTCPICNEKAEFALLLEEDAAPNTAYGISKYAAEITALRFGHKYNIPTVCLRYSLVQGSGQSIHNAYSGIGRIFNQRLLRGKPIIAYEDGNQIRDFVHVEDVVDANLLVMKSELADYNTYNVGGERPVTVNEYADKLNALFGSELRTETPGIYRWGDPRHTCSSSEKLEAIGWKRKHTIDDIVRDAHEWFSQMAFNPTFEEAEQLMLQRGVLRKSAQ